MFLDLHILYFVVVFRSPTFWWSSDPLTFGGLQIPYLVKVFRPSDPYLVEVFVEAVHEEQ